MINQVHPACLPVEKLLSDCRFERTRRGGPGGQHRNKVESAVVVTHQPTGVTGQASERRSQHANRTVAIERLRLNLALEVRQAVEASRNPSELWQSRTSGQRISVSQNHSDYPALLAESLDFVAAFDFDLKAASNRLVVSGSQLVKFIKTTPPAFEWVNQNRADRKLGKLK